MNDLELATAEWLDALHDEYLSSFVSDGGAAVKVAVVPDAVEGAGVTRSLLAQAREQGFIAAAVDSGACKVHLLHNLFTEIARQVDWDELARDFVRSELRSAGFALPGDGSLEVETVARLNDQDVMVVKQDARKLLTGLMRDRGLSRQFRLGARALCQALLEPDDLNQELARYVRDWLRGELPRVGVLRDAFIYQRIDRHTARTMILSMSAFIRRAGRRGLLVVVDISRYALPKPLDDGRNRYSKAAALDMWETLRQFVDGTDDMSGGLFVFVVGREFVEDDERGLRGYPALHLRLTDDVRDRRRANPLAAMVRLAENGTC